MNGILNAISEIFLGVPDYDVTRVLGGFNVTRETNRGLVVLGTYTTYDEAAIVAARANAGL